MDSLFVKNNPDPRCPERVVPASRRKMTQYDPADWASSTTPRPSRRIAEVARHFAETYGNGAISSMCSNDYSDALRQIRERIRQRLSGRCLPRPLETRPPLCSETIRTDCLMPGQNVPVQVNCVVREILPAGVTSIAACTAARDRTPGPRETSVECVQDIGATR